jgi:hypothetical protein
LKEEKRTNPTGSAVAWLGSLVLCLLTFRQIRKHPHSSGFVPPGSQFPADADEEAAFSRPSYEPGYAPTPTDENPFNSRGDVGGYRPSLAYEEGGERLFDEDGLRGQGYDHSQQRHDPFEDPQDGYSAGGRYGASDDPYEAIRKVRFPLSLLSSFPGAFPLSFIHSLPSLPLIANATTNALLYSQSMETPRPRY